MHGKAFSSLGIPLDPITQDSCIFYEDHTVITEQGGAVVFEVEAGKELASKFPTGKAAIHRNHGLFTVGQTVDEAAFWFLSMERSCQAQLLAMAAGTPQLIDHEVAEYTPQADRATRWPAGSASRRCGRRSAARTPTCSTETSPARAAHAGDSIRASTGVLAGGAVRPRRHPQNAGHVLAKSLFDEVDPATVAWFRVTLRGGRPARAVVAAVVRREGVAGRGRGRPARDRGVRRRHRR